MFPLVSETSSSHKHVGRDDKPAVRVQKSHPVCAGLIAHGGGSLPNGRARLCNDSLPREEFPAQPCALGRAGRRPAGAWGAVGLPQPGVAPAASGASAPLLELDEHPARFSASAGLSLKTFSRILSSCFKEVLNNGIPPPHCSGCSIAQHPWLVNFPQRPKLCFSPTLLLH